MAYHFTVMASKVDPGTQEAFILFDDRPFSDTAGCRKISLVCTW
jgi:hypothetical protein